ncbi:MAG: 50S ribosomal protein L6 [bacterium]|nr:50S ribosomal protein L6 [bacterium]
MSRIGKKLMAIPTGVTVDAQNGVIKVKGPKGELITKLHPRVAVAVKDNTVTVSVANENNTDDRALWGTFGSLVNNMLVGVVAGYKKQLEINGVGYKAALKGADLVLEVGFSNPVTVSPLPGVKFTVEKNVITVEGIDKQAVGEMAAMIRKVRKPEPYKGKGIKYMDEILRKKEGKAAGKAAA